MDVDQAEGIIEASQTQEIAFILDATGLAERVYEGQLLFRHNAADLETSLPVTLTVTLDAANNEDVTIPDQFGITGIYPNPFNSATTIQYSLPAAAHVSLVIYDIHGRKIEVLVNERVGAGDYFACRKPEALPSGLYFVKLNYCNTFQIRKLVLIR